MTNEQTAVLLMNIAERIAVEVVLLRGWLQQDVDTKNKGWFIQLEKLCDDLRDQANILIAASQPNAHCSRPARARYAGRDGQRE